MWLRRLGESLWGEQWLTIGEQWGVYGRTGGMVGESWLSLDVNFGPN
jgi:hypothetical protein